MNTQHSPKTTHHLRTVIRRLLLPAGALGMPALALAGGPTGEVIVGGDVEVNRPNTNTTVIDQASWRAIIDWQTFNIGLDEYVMFNQPGTNAVILNRIIGGDPTSILGSLTANGQVFLVNPYGVFFGSSAQLDVHGLLATTLDISNDDFMAGNYSFTKAGGTPDAGVVNEGRITADGGYVVLAADHVANSGVVAARAGHVVMAAGSAFTLDIEGDGLVSFAVDEAALSEMAGVSNAGTILADGGVVLMTAKVANDLVATAVNNEGLIQAHSISEQDGVIYLAAEGGDIVNAGTLDANGVSSQDGGGIILHGDANIDLQDGSVITAAGSGAASGGVIRVIAEDTLFFRENATIRATGGEANGGFVEVSGHYDLELNGSLDIGSGGELLIDPNKLAIQTGTSAGGTSYGGTACTAGCATVGVDFIENQLNAGVDVSLVAQQQIFYDGVGETLAATSAGSLGPGNLFMGIGTVTLTGPCLNLGICTTDPVGAGFVLGTGGTIDLDGLNINIQGNFDIQTINGLVFTDNISAANITMNGATIQTGMLTAVTDITLTGSNAAFISIAGSGTAAVNAGGNFTINNASGRVDIGTGSFTDVGPFTGQSVTAGGNITITTGTLDTGALTATTGNINVTADNGRITVGNGSDGTGPSPVLTFTGAAVTAGGSVQLNVTGNTSGAVQVLTGNVSGTAVNLQAINNDNSYGGDAVIRTGNVTATAGLIRLLADAGNNAISGSAEAKIDAGKLTATDTVTVEAITGVNTAVGGHIVTGVISGEEIFVHHNGNKADISLGSLIANNTAGRALVDVVTGDGNGLTQAGNITINGDINVAGVAVSSTCGTSGNCLGPFNQPVAAQVNLQAGNSGVTGLAPGNVTVTGNVDVTATAANVSVTRNTESGATTVTGTAGAANFFVLGNSATVGGSVNLGGADVLVDVQANQVSFGGASLNATGHNITLNDNQFFGTGSLTSANNAGNAVMHISGIGSGSGSGEPPASSVTLGAVIINGIGDAGLHIAALSTSLASVTVNAAAATYDRTLTGNYTGSLSNVAFSNNNQGDDFNLDQGTVTIGSGRIGVGGGTSCVSSACTENPAASLTATGNLSVTGVGQAQISAFATNINITGGLTATATAGSVTNGDGVGTFSSGTGASTAIYNVSTTASGTFGDADIELRTDAGSGAGITVGGPVAVSGPVAGFTADAKGDVQLGAVTVTGTGENYHETNLYTLSSGPSGALPSFTTSFQGARETGGVLISGVAVTAGDLTLQGVGFMGALVSGTTVALQDVSITTTAMNQTTLDTRLSPTAVTTPRGEAVFGITNVDISGAPVAGATVTGNVLLDADVDAHVGINAAISGTLTVLAAGDIDTTMPSFISDSGSQITLPPLNASADAMNFNAGGNIQLTGSTLTIGNGNSGVSADTAVAAAGGVLTAPVNGMFAAGGTLDLGNLSMTGNYLWLRANQFGAIGTVTLPATALVQFTTFDPTRSLGLDLGTGGTAQTTLTEAYVSAFSGANYLAIGDSARTGDLLLGETSVVNLPTEQMIFATDGNITGTNSVSAARVDFVTSAISNIAANLNTGIVTMAVGNDVDLQLAGPAIFTFGTGLFGDVSLVTTGDLTLQSGLAAADILLQTNTGGLILGNNGLLATNSMTLDVDTTFSGTGQLAANTLNLIGAATTDFSLFTNVAAFNVQSGNNITLNNTAHFGATTLSFGASPFGAFTGFFGDTITLGSAFTGTGFDLHTTAGDFTYGANTIDVASGIIALDVGGAQATGTGLLTAGTLNLTGAATTDFNLLTNIAAFNVLSGNDVTIDNSGFSGAASALFGSGTFGLVSLVTTGDLTLQSGISATDILLQANTGGMTIATNGLTATNSITLDADAFVGGIGLLTTNTLSLIGGTVADFNLRSNAAVINLVSGNDIALNNSAFTGAATVSFGAGIFGAFTGNFGGDTTLASAFTGTGFALNTPGNFTFGANTVNAGVGNITLDVGGTATGTGLLTANDFTLIGETNTDYDFTTKANWISIQSAGGITIDNTAHTGSAYIFFGSDTFTDVAFTMGGDTDIGTASNLTADNASIVVNNGSLDISNHTFNIANDLGLSADNSIFIAGATITAGNLLMVAGSDITDSSGGQGGVKQGAQSAAALAPASITADAMTLLAGGDILLSQTTFAIGNGDMSDLTGIGGDTELLAQLSEEGIAPAGSAPNATLIAQGGVQLGAMSVAGGYLYVEAADVDLNGAITGPSNLLVQLVPFGGIGTITLENTAGTAGTINLGATGVSLIQDGATLALGSSVYQGNVTLGQNGTVDVGARNFVVATTGTIDNLANITSTGLVASLEELVSGPDVFDEPTLEEIDADYNSNPSGDDDEEGEEEGEDTDDDGVPDSEGDNALIQHDSSGETKVCAG